MAVKRWDQDQWLYRDRVFTGTVLDIGGTGDPISNYRTYLPNMGSVTILDHNSPNTDDRWWNMDATTVPPGYQFQTVYSSHTLEHITNCWDAVRSWWQAVAPGGYMVIIVPSWYTYEREVWPPRFNTDHKHAWSASPSDTLAAHGLIDVADQAHTPGNRIVHLLTLDKGFIPGPHDQTADYQCESGLELVLWKPDQ